MYDEGIEPRPSAWQLASKSRNIAPWPLRLLVLSYEGSEDGSNILYSKFFSSLSSEEHLMI